MCFTQYLSHGYYRVAGHKQIFPHFFSNLWQPWWFLSGLLIVIFLAYWIFKGGVYFVMVVPKRASCINISIFFLMQNLSQIINFSKKCNIFLLDCANFVCRNGWQIKTKDAEEIFIVLKKRFFIMQKQIIFLHLYLVNAVNKVKTINNYCLYLSY